MLVIINAMKSITRSKGRNILIGIIVLAIAASSCVALAIRSAANEAEVVGMDYVNITGYISVDRTKMMEAFQGGSGAFGGNSTDMNAMRDLMSQYQSLSLSDQLFYAESNYVKNFYFSGSISLNATGDLEAYSTDSSSGSSGNSFTFPGGMVGQGRGASMMGSFAMGDFTITGYSSMDAMTKFIDGTSKVTDGVVFDMESSDMDCIISKELALFNGLSVGDTIILANPNSIVSEETEDGTVETATEIYAFTIVGIYTDSSSNESSSQMRFSTSQDPANLICISYNTLQSIIDYSDTVAVTEVNEEWGIETSSALSTQPSGTYVFSNKENYDGFSAELTARGLSEYYTLSSSDINSYESSLLPLQNLSNFATTMLFIILAIGAVILIVINVFNIRERKYEVGVLTAVGIKKGKVAMQFVTELLCVTLVAIIIGAGVGAAASVPVSNNLLSSQIEQLQTEQNNQSANFGMPGGGGMQNFQGRQNRQGSNSMFSMFDPNNQSNVNYLDKINATVDFSILGQLIGIGIILTLISSFAAVIFVMRYEPLKILANRS